MSSLVVIKPLSIPSMELLFGLSITGLTLVSTIDFFWRCLCDTEVFLVVPVPTVAALFEHTAMISLLGRSASSQSRRAARLRYIPVAGARIERAKVVYRKYWLTAPWRTVLLLRVVPRD